MEKQNTKNTDFDLEKEVGKHLLHFDRQLEKVRNNPEQALYNIEKYKEHYMKEMIKAMKNNDDNLNRLYNLIIKDILDPQLKQLKLELEQMKRIVSESRNTGNDVSEKVEPTRVEKSDFEPVASVPPKQLEPDATPEEIMNYFMILYHNKNMLKEDVEDLVQNNFKVFGRAPVKKTYPIEIRYKNILCNFVYQFYLKYDSGRKEDYARLLINSFDKFSATSLEVLLTNMGKPVSKKHAILIDDYLKSK